MLSLHDKGQMPLGSVIFRAEVQIRTLEVSYKAKLGSLVSILLSRRRVYFYLRGKLMPEVQVHGVGRRAETRI